MNGYLKKEQQGKEKTSLFQQSYAEVAELEKEVVAMKREEQALERFIAEVKGQRERVSLQTALKTAKWRETEELVQVKDLIVVDLKKKRRDTNRRLRDFQQLYDLIKSQRNKFVNMIQTSSQSIAEMKEKLKILGNEIEILRTEAADKEHLLAKARADHANAQIERDHLRSDLNKCILSFRERQGVVEEQITEIDKLNSIINTTERDMLRLKKQYETSVEERNYSGVMLIDRNDELCILYEKVNLQEEVLRQWEISLWRREDEIRVLNIAIRDMQYSIDVTRKTLPQIPHLDESIASLQHQLLEAREEAEALEAALETPGNKSRWRYLDGKIPEKAELVTKINQLEERLNDKKEQLLEKNLILEEVPLAPPAGPGGGGAGRHPGAGAQGQRVPEPHAGPHAEDDGHGVGALHVPGDEPEAGGGEGGPGGREGLGGGQPPAGARAQRRRGARVAAHGARAPAAARDGAGGRGAQGGPGEPRAGRAHHGRAPAERVRARGHRHPEALRPVRALQALRGGLDHAAHPQARAPGDRHLVAQSKPGPERERQRDIQIVLNVSLLEESEGDFRPRTRRGPRQRDCRAQWTLSKKVFTQAGEGAPTSRAILASAASEG